jgi:hypothetical protein
MPFHPDNATVVKERISLDRADPNILHDDVTTIDHALTRPWTVTRSYRRDAQQTRPQWSEFVCSENAGHIQIGNESYRLSPDGYLAPVRKGQAPPDLKYFK